MDQTPLASRAQNQATTPRGQAGEGRATRNLGMEMGLQQIKNLQLSLFPQRSQMPFMIYFRTGSHQGPS